MSIRRLLVLSLLSSASWMGICAPPAAQTGQLRIPVTATDDAATPLRLADLRVQVNGAAAKAVQLRGPADPLVLLIVFDLSGDIAAAEQAKEALIVQVKELPKNVLTGLLRSQDGLQVLMDPTADRDKLAAAIQQVAVSGRSAFLDTVENSCRIADSMMRKSGVRVQVLYVTDSNIYNYRDDYVNPVVNSSDSRDLSRRFPEGLIREKISNLSSKLLALQAPLFFVHLSYQTDRLNEAYQSGLMQLTTELGGVGQFCRSVTEIPEQMAAVTKQMLSQYLLTVQLPSKAKRAVQIQLRAEERNLVYRSRFVLAEKKVAGGTGRPVR